MQTGSKTEVQLVYVPEIASVGFFLGRSLPSGVFSLRQQLLLLF